MNKKETMTLTIEDNLGMNLLRETCDAIDNHYGLTPKPVEDRLSLLPMIQNYTIKDSLKIKSIFAHRM